MGTGLLAPLYRLEKALIERAYRYVDARRDDRGVPRSMSYLTEQYRSSIASTLHYRARFEIALDVASAYPGGDYFEFGSSGLASFRCFLAAFQINVAHTKHFPQTKFYAFDIFGDPDQGRGPESNRDFFEAWRQPFDMAAPLAALKPYTDLKDRCVLVQGYFEDTLNDDFRAKMRANNQKIGYAFVDCNSEQSYKVVFDFLIDVIGADKMFIYLDEYFMDAPVDRLYRQFTEEAKKRYGLNSLYMRNAGSFGALFCLMPGVRHPISDIERTSGALFCLMPGLD
jgi:hypothetical protein